MNLWHDMRYGWRTMRKSPGFTVTAIVTMALGIGATTAMFSVCDAMLWKPLPLPHLESLVTLVERVPNDPIDWDSTTPADVEDIRRESTSFRSMAVWDDGQANLAGAGGEPERVNQNVVSANFFDVLGVGPARGRAFLPGEDQPGRQREAVLSDQLWRRRFGADPDIIGKQIQLDFDDYTVVGIMPRQFEFPIGGEIWTPLALDPDERASRTQRMLMAVARLKPERTVSQAAAEIDSIGAGLAQRYPDTNRNRRFRLLPAHEFLVGPYSPQYVLMLFGSVLFVLLIACANLANLQYARATGRTREVAVRTALGAGRWRLMGQLLTESVLLCVAGAGLGLLVASWGIDLMRNSMSPEVERHVLGWHDLGLDGRALVFTLVAAVASGILAGLAPAWQISRPNVNAALKDGTRGAFAGRGRHGLRSILVAAEIALAVVLLVGAGLMARSFHSLVNGGSNYEPATMLTLRLAISESKYGHQHQRNAFYSEVLERTGALPGVRAAVLATALPYSGHSTWRVFRIEGKRPEPGNQPTGMYHAVSTNYFQTMHIPLLGGRWLNAGDGAESPRVAVINERTARQWWPGEALPIGKHFKIVTPGEDEGWTTVVGVAGNAAYNVYDRAPRAVVYVPYVQESRHTMDIGIRTAGDPMRLAKAVTAAIRWVDPEQPVTGVCTLETLQYRQAVGLNYVAVMMGIFGLLALALASVGVYGVMAYLVSEQTHEIGIRMALGAPHETVLAMVFRRGMLTTGAGLGAGLAAAYALARVMESLMWGVTATDPATFAGIPLALMLSAALAIYIPARRAMKIDPIVALRYE